MNEEISKYLSDEVVQQVLKDLILAGFTPPPLIDYSQAYLPLLEFFKEEIDKNPKALRTFLYTLDLTENRVGQALANVSKEDGSVVFLTLCLQRAAEKIEWRKKFKEGNY